MTQDPLHISSNSSNIFHLSQIFIGREQQLDLFQLYFSRWKQLIFHAEPDDDLVSAAPSSDNKIQGLVVLIYGRGGIGKSTLLRRYREIALQSNNTPLAGRIIASNIVDWESVSEGKRGLFAAAPNKGIDAAGYFRLLTTQLAIALGKDLDNFKHYRRAAQDVEDSRKEAERVIEMLRSDERYAGLRWAAGEGLITLLRLVPYVGTPLRNEQIAGKAKELLGEGAAITTEQLVRLHTRLRDKLGTKFGDYLEPDLKLSLKLGSDLRELARNYPLLIFFDTYETIDEGDRLLRMVMAAAGRRVGWVVAGRDNLWAGVDQRLRSLGIEYGYREIVLPDRGLDIDFSKSNTGSFTRSDIKTYFDEMCRRVPCDPPLLQITEEQSADIEKVTRGIPLAVRIAAAIYMDTKNMSTITEREQGQRDIVDQMVRRYLLHVRDDESDRPKLYGLALLPRADQPSAVTTVLQLSSDEAKTRYDEELARLQRRYSFIFTEAEQPALHDELRYFLRLWLLEHCTQPNITAINERLKASHDRSFQQLEERRQYNALKERLQDDEWVNIYLDLVEQWYWLDPVEGVRLLLPFMLAAAIYRRDVNEEASEIGKFFENTLGSPYRSWWTWVSESLVYLHSRTPSPEELRGLEELQKLLRERSHVFAPPLSAYLGELEAALWWRLGEAYTDSNDRKALEWYEKALTRLGQEGDLKEAAARVALNSADKASEKRSWAESIHLASRAIELKSDNVSAYLNRGWAFYCLKEFQRALEDFNWALEFDPRNIKALNDQGIVHRELKQYDRAVANFNQALEIDPLYPWAYGNRGGLYTELREYERAFADFNRALELDHNLAFVYVERGIAYRERGDYEHAFGEFNQALVLSQQSLSVKIWAYNNRGIGYHYQGEYLLAIADYNQTLKIDPHYAIAYNNRGDSYRELKQYEQALADFNHALSLEPKYGWCYGSRGQVYSNMKEYQHAIADFNKALELNSHLDWIYVERGQAYKHIKQYELAIRDFNAAIKLDKEFSQAYFERGLTYLHIGNVKQARADIRHGTHNDDMHGWSRELKCINAFWIIAWLKICEKENYFRDIAKGLQVIISMNEQHYVAYVCRGIILGSEGRLKEALAELEQAILLDPDRWDAYFWNGMLCAYYYKGRHLKAIEAIEKALERNLPPLLLKPLSWLEKNRHDFFEHYARPLLEQYNI